MNSEPLNSRTPRSVTGMRARPWHEEQSTTTVPRSGGPTENIASRPSRWRPGRSWSGGAATGASNSARLPSGSNRVIGARSREDGLRKLAVRNCGFRAWRVREHGTAAGGRLGHADRLGHRRVDHVEVVAVADL